MKFVLASIFMFIFSFQVLPVKEIGKLLFKGTMTEEIHETEPDAGNKIKKDTDPYMPYKAQGNYNNNILHACGRLKTTTPENVSKQHIPDIITPPPNYAG